jgi:hypothetical protein
MGSAKLIIKTPGQSDRELQLSGGASIGRAFDNGLRIEAEGISRYHAIIDQRADGFWLSDLGSRNGTTVNGTRLAAERKLDDGDSIVLGERATLEFQLDGAYELRSPRTEPPAPSGDARAGAVQSDVPLSNDRPVSTDGRPAVLIGLIVVAVVVGVLLIAQIISRSRSVDIDSNKEARSGPRAEAKLPVDAERSRSGEATTPMPVDNQRPDRDGAGRSQEPEAGGESEPPANLATAQMCQNLAGLIVGKSGSGYVFPAGFIAQVRNHTDEYHVDMREHVRSHKFQINKAFNTTPLHKVTGYLLAISRSRFTDDSSSSSGIGLWRVPKDIALSYKAPEEPESLINDPERSAEVAAQYFKGLIDVFGQDDFMYAIACFGMPTSKAGDLRTLLEKADPGERRDFWRLAERRVVPPDGVDLVVRFFAAGIVAENPRAFGIDSKPLSWLISN